MLVSRQLPRQSQNFCIPGTILSAGKLALGVTWIRFRSSIFNASAVGLKTSVTYFTNEWFGIEGNVSAAFATGNFLTANT